MSDEDLPLPLRLVVAAVTAVVAAATVTYLFGSTGVALPMWAIDLLFWGGALLAVAAVWALDRRNGGGAAAGGRSERERGARPVLRFLPLAVLLPAIAVYLKSPRLQMSFHGNLHSAYTYAVLNGQIPPDNPMLSGEPANDYWLFHVLLAAVVHVTRLAPPLAGALLNLVALAGSLFFVSRIAKELGLWPKSALARGCATLVALFAFNLFGVVHVLVDARSSEVTDPLGLSEMVVSGAARSSGLLAKFLNFNGFPVGVFMFLLALFCAVRLTEQITAWSVAGFLAGALGAFAFHVTTGLFALAVLPAAILLSCLITRRRPSWGMTRAAAGVLVPTSLVVLGALLHYALTAASALEETGSLGFSKLNLTRFLGVAYPVLPLFLIGAWWAVRARAASRVLVGLVAAGGALLACFALLPGENQYKFDFLALLAGGFVALAAWRRLWEGDRTRVIAGVLAALALALVAANQTYTALSYGRSRMADDGSIAYDGRDVVGGANSGQAPAWEWIKDNTSPEAIVVVPLTSRDRARFLALSQRRAYVVKGGIYTSGNTEFEHRRRIVQTLYSRRASDDARSSALGRLVLDLGETEAILAATRSNARTIGGLGLPLVFSEGSTTLYELTRD